MREENAVTGGKMWEWDFHCISFCTFKTLYHVINPLKNLFLLKNIFKVFPDPPLSQWTFYFFTKLLKGFVSIYCPCFRISILSSTYSNLVLVPTILLKLPCPGHYILYLAKSSGRISTFILTSQQYSTLLTTSSLK